MKTAFLDFEQPIGRARGEIEELRFAQDDSATGCSKSRNAVFIGKIPGAIVPEARSAPRRSQYSTGIGFEAAPEIPGCDRAPGFPTEAILRIVRSETERPRKIVQTDGTLQSQVVQRQHIGRNRQNIKEHFRGPAADAANLDELGDHRLVLHPGPGRDVQAPFDEMAREPAEDTRPCAATGRSRPASRVPRR